MASCAAISLRAALPDARLAGADDVMLSRCSCDSRRCQPGDLFVAVRGTQHDGHGFVAEAIARGARAVVAEQPLPDCPVPICYVPDARVAYAHVCQALADHPSRRLAVVGVTGTNGKTTTSLLIASILAAADMQPGVMGTLGYVDSVDIAHAPWTTPPADVLATWLANMATHGCSHAVLEVSSHALAQLRVAGIEFDAVCFTNVRHDHLDYHGTLPAYRAAKARLLSHLRPEGFAVFNVDDPTCRRLLDRCDGPVLTVGLHEAAELSATLVDRCASEQMLLLSTPDETVPVRTPLVGTHNVYNCLLAAAVGQVYGIDLHTIARGLESLDHVPGRLERIECGQPFSVFVDYAHTPDALAAALDTLRDLTPGRLLCVFGAGGERDWQKRPGMGRAVERRAEIGVLTNDNPRREPPQQIFDQVRAGCHDPRSLRVIPDRASAIAHVLAEARSGDCVLVAGKGHETVQLIGSQRFHFDDREVIRDWLFRHQVPHRLYRTIA